MIRKTRIQEVRKDVDKWLELHNRAAKATKSDALRLREEADRLYQSRDIAKRSWLLWEDYL